MLRYGCRSCFRIILFTERQLGSKSSLYCAFEDPMPYACVENAHPGRFIQNDFFCAATSRFPAGNDIAELRDDVLRLEFSACQQSIEWLARRVVAQHLIASREEYARAQYRRFVEFPRRKRHEQHAGFEPASFEHDGISAG